MACDVVDEDVLRCEGRTESVSWMVFIHGWVWQVAGTSSCFPVSANDEVNHDGPQFLQGTTRHGPLPRCMALWSAVEASSKANHCQSLPIAAIQTGQSPHSSLSTAGPSYVVVPRTIAVCTLGSWVHPPSHCIICTLVYPARGAHAVAATVCDFI